MDNDERKLLQQLLDIEALKTLKHQYCAYCDDSYNPDGLASLFTEDAVWNGGEIGVLHGREAIREFFAESSAAVPFALHIVTNPIIDIAGETASCEWYLWQPMVFADPVTPEAYWFAAKYNDVCTKIDGTWFFHTVVVTTRMLSPYQDGFARTLIAATYPGT